jgi:SOS response regulatory protein OraA/RecX
MRGARGPKDSSDANECYDVALRLLAVRAHSRLQLARKLGQRGFEREAVDATIERLVSEKWLDESRFAEELVRTQIRKQHGHRRIERELEAAGVDRRTSTAAVQASEEAAPESERLEAACRKKLDSLSARYGTEYFTEEDGRKKLAAFLLKQGYDASDVIEEVDRQVRAFIQSSRSSQENS